MYPVSAAFLTALRSASMIAAVRVVGVDGTVLGVVDGKVDMDSRRSIIRTATCEFAPTDALDVRAVYDYLMQPATEVRIFRGLVVDAAGTIEYVPLGVFSTDSADVEDDSSSTVSWSASDRSKKIARARFTDAYAITAGTLLADAGAALLTSRWSLVEYDFSNVTATIGAGVTFDGGAESDPWKSARDLFADYGFDLAFDGNGVCRATPIPDPATVAPAFDYGAGQTNLVLGGTLSGSFETTYNGAIVTGESTDLALTGTPPARAEVWDTDPTSPTYVDGGFGKVPYFYSSPVLMTNDQCAVAAATILARVKGRKSGFAWPAVVNPALVPLDVVTVTRRAKYCTLVLDKLTVPLRSQDAMTTIAREVSVL